MVGTDELQVIGNLIELGRIGSATAGGNREKYRKFSENCRGRRKNPASAKFCDSS
jgi:hypothetical protein